MTPDDPAPDDDLASMLAACDEALAGGQLPPVDPPGDLSAEQSRLLKGLDCVRLLRTVWPRAEQPTSFAPAPTHIGRYRIARELGRGGFGIVYLAFDPQLARQVALKVPRPDVAASPQARERFRREARAAASLDHPNVVAVHEAGAADGTEYIAAAYCPGLTLAKWLEQRTDPVPVRVAVPVLVQLAAGVEHAHQRQVLHRDLKPANVLLSFDDGPDVGEPLAKLTDFGLARSLADVTGAGLTDTGAILGTPDYLAPEQADSKAGPVGPGADVYGLGAILYELLTRRPPFQSDSVLDTLQQVRADDPVPPRRLRSQVPRDLETICLKCLEKNPARRYHTARELADDLLRF